MNILQTFGLNPYLTIAQIINFLILFYILKRYLYPPLFKVFKKREELVKESIEKAEKSEKALEKAKEEEKIIIKKAHATAAEIVSDARERADDIIKQGEDETKQRTDQMVKTAKAQIELERSETEEQLNKYVLDLSVELLKKTLPSVFSEKEQSEIIDKAVKSMQKQTN